MEREGELERTTRDERFSREFRLRSSASFQRVRRTGKRRQGRFVTLLFARAAQANGVDPAPARVGFSVSKRVGDAVTRNRVKRRLREVVRRRLWQVAPGWDMILTARPEAASADYTALRTDVEMLFTQARVLRLPDSASVTTNDTNYSRDETQAR